MIEVSPLAAPGAEPWLARLAAAGLDLWIARGDAAELDAALVGLVGRGSAEPWSVEVRGRGGAVRYATEVALAADGHDGPGGLVGGPAAVAAVLDAAATTGSAVLLAQPPGERPRLAVVRGPRGVWAVLAVRPGLDPRALVPAAWSARPAPPPPAPPPARRVDRRLAALASVAATAVLAGAVVATLTLRRQGGATAVATTSPAATASPSLAAPATAAALPGSRPAVSFGPSVAFDRRHGVAVLTNGAGAGGQTWTWGGRYWSQVHPRSAPDSRVGAAMAFDPRHGDLVLFGGGFTAQQPTAETWTWDGTEWARAEPMLQQPPPAEFAAMADDPVSGALLLVTGDSAWSWDGTAWHQRARVPGAGSVDTEVLGLDSASGSDILVRDSRGSVTTWRWDGARWTELHPAHQPPAPEPEFPELIATDPVTGHPVLNVSTTPTADSPVSQTWTWDGADWTEQPQSSLGAVPLGLLSDSALGTVVALVDPPGGSTAETMAWIGERWVRIAGTEDAGYDGVGPTPRDGTGSAADAVSGRLLLVGGREFGSGAPLNPLGDTWTWTGAAWSRWDQAGPPPRSGGLLAPDPSGGVLLFGGFDQTRVQPALLDTWRWGAAGWTPLHPAVTPPPGSAGVGMATDSRLGATVLLTTCCSGDLRPLDERSAMQTWTWDGSTWTLRHPAHSPLGEAMLVDDPVRGRVLALVDEVDTADTPVPPELDTWAWDGTDWQDLHATTAGRFRGAAADPVTGDVVALSDPQEGVGGTQLFDGRGWLRRPLPDEPDAAALGTPMLVDPQLGRLVVLSGPSGELTEEWMWTGQAWVQLDLSRPPAAPAPAVPFHHGGYPPPP